jgi:hypothetical protein
LGTNKRINAGWTICPGTASRWITCPAMGEASTIRDASPAAPGREARQDSEYKRCGTANVFCAVEPKAGRHFTLGHAGGFVMRRSLGLEACQGRKLISYEWVVAEQAET